MSESHGHLCPYSNVWPEAAYCLHCLNVCMIKVRGSLSFVYLHRLVSEISTA